MNLKNNRLVCDADGQWWYLAGRKRQRQRVPPPQPCPRCGVQFISNNGKVKFCSHRCAMLTHHEQRIDPVVTQGVVPDTIHVHGNRAKFSQDASGQWWYSSGGYRLKTEVAICNHCHREFLGAHNRSNRRTEYCSRKCGVQATYAKMPLADRTYEKARAYQGGRIRDQHGYVMKLAPDHPSNVGTTRRYVQEHRLVMEQTIGRPLIKGEQVHHKNNIRDDNRPENLELWVGKHPSGSRAGEQQHCPTCSCFQHKLQHD